MMKYKNNYFPFWLLAAIIITGMVACSKMDSTYRDFWKNGETIYPASADSLKIYSGKNRVEITWLILGDPSIKKAKVFWNNGADSLQVPISRTGNKVDTVKIVLENMQEGTYTFNIYTYDDKGNRSVGTTAVGKAYGDSYEGSLLSRIINSAFFLDDSLKIVWGDPADETSLGSEILYTDTSGNPRQLLVAPNADTTIITDYDFNAGHNFQYRTLYFPDSTSLDTFYTSYKAVRVKGPRQELSKSGWTATASSYDARSGTARAPASAIDNNTSTIWVNQISPQTYYPHSITVDMGSVVPNVAGLTFLVSQRAETPKLIQILISTDSITWTPMGSFTLEYINNLQYVDFLQEQDCRYFKVIAEQPYGNTNNIVIKEVGAFIR